MAGPVLSENCRSIFIRYSHWSLTGQFGITERMESAPGHFLEIERGPWERGCRYFNRAGAGDEDGYSKRVTHVFISQAWALSSTLILTRCYFVRLVIELRKLVKVWTRLSIILMPVFRFRIMIRERSCESQMVKLFPVLKQNSAVKNWFWSTEGKLGKETLANSMDKNSYQFYFHLPYFWEGATAEYPGEIEVGGKGLAYTRQVSLG